MSLITAVASNSKDSNFVMTVKKIDMSVIIGVRIPAGTVAVGTRYFIEINGADNMIISMLAEVLDFFV